MEGDIVHELWLVLLLLTLTSRRVVVQSSKDQPLRKLASLTCHCLAVVTMGSAWKLPAVWDPGVHEPTSAQLQRHQHPAAVVQTEQHRIVKMIAGRQTMAKALTLATGSDHSVTSSQRHERCSHAVAMAHEGSSTQLRQTAQYHFSSFDCMLQNTWKRQHGHENLSAR
jgi:hypothetical protein